MKMRGNSHLAKLGAIFLASGVASMALVAGPAANASVAGVIANGAYLLQNVNSGKCADLDFLGNNAPIFQFTCAANNSFENWGLENVGGNNYEVVNQATDLCLAIGANNTNNGTGAIDWACAGIPDQIWTAVQVGSDFELVNENSGLCLAVGGSDTNNGAWIIQWTCAGIPDQLWNVTT